MTAQVRTFDSGATRNLDDTKPDFEGFLSPLVMRAYGRYMHKHRILPNGDMRASDNWQAGIPLDVYVKSAFRHFLDFHAGHRGYDTAQSLEDDLCALLFNISGYLHEYLKVEMQTDAIPAESVEAMFDEARSGAIAAGPDRFPLSGIVARVPPFVTRDADDEMGLTAGQAIEPGASYGGSA